MSKAADVDLIAVTDARGQTTSFDYDLRDRLIERSNPFSQAIGFTYDSRDNLLTQVTTPDNLIALGYDAAGNALTVADDDSDLAFTYDGLNRVLTASTGLGGVQPLVVLTNTYDAVGNRISLADDAGVSGAVTGFVHDGAGRLTELTTPASQTIDLAYDPAGRTTGISYPNTVTSALSYEPLTGRLSNLTHSRGTTDLADFAYGYDAIGKIASIAELTQTRDFTYDLLRRLIGGGTAGTPETYTYDPEGNRTASHLSGLHVTDIANRLTEDDDFTYVYDLNGNLETKTAKVGGAVTAYTWDAEDRLTRIDLPDLTFAAYRYDGLGRRIEKDGSEAVILGCAGMADLTVWLSRETGVPVIDGVVAGVKLIEALVGAGLATSKAGAYAAPLAKN